MDAEKTDSGFSAKAHVAALKAQEAARKANAKADPFADRLLDTIKASPWTIAYLAVSHSATFALGLWAAWPKK